MENKQNNINSLENILVKYDYQHRLDLELLAELQSLITTHEQQVREEGKDWYFEGDELVIKKGKWVIDRYKKHGRSLLDKATRIDMTMTEAVELSKDKDSETKRVLQQARRDGVMEFIKYYNADVDLTKPSREAGEAAGMIYLANEFLEENPSA
jgi:hypothetical protein